jgi:hypothetical protein
VFLVAAISGGGIAGLRAGSRVIPLGRSPAATTLVATDAHGRRVTLVRRPDGRLVVVKRVRGEGLGRAVFESGIFWTVEVGSMR